MKEAIKALIAQGKLDDALAQLREVAKSLSAHDVVDAVTVLEARLAENRQQANLNTHDPEDISRERNNISLAVLNILKQLPGEAASQSAPLKGVTEQTMKRHILALTLFVKMAVLAWLYNHWQSGGFSSDQFLGTLTVLLPILATYGGVMFKDFLDHRHVQSSEATIQPRIRRSVQWTVYAVISGYGLALCIAIGAKAQGSISYSGLSAVLALIESGLGIYLMHIVKAFFPQGKKSDD